jgi:hypothetical protein
MRDDLGERRALVHQFRNKLTPLAARLRLASRSEDPARRDAHVYAALEDLERLCEWMTALSRQLAHEAHRYGPDESADLGVHEASWCIDATSTDETLPGHPRLLPARGASSHRVRVG